MNEFYDERTVTARKEHKCVEHKCVRTKVIKIGQQYRRCVGKQDGDFFQVAQCLRCSRLAHKAIGLFTENANDEEGCTFGNLYDYIKECRR
jgi:hypothetical protein